MVTFSSLMPRSSVMHLPPVRIAISSHSFTTIKTRGFYSTGAIASMQLVDHQCCKSFAFNIFSDDEELLASLGDGLQERKEIVEVDLLSWMRTYASSRTADMSSEFVTKYGAEVTLVELHTNSPRVSSMLFASSTVMVPSLPTLSIASAMISPISESELSRDCSH